MANIREKAISILVENLNLGLSYLITTVTKTKYPVGVIGFNDTLPQK